LEVDHNVERKACPIGPFRIGWVGTITDQVAVIIGGHRLLLHCCVGALSNISGDSPVAASLLTPTLRAVQTSTPIWSRPSVTREVKNVVTAPFEAALSSQWFRFVVPAAPRSSGLVFEYTGLSPPATRAAIARRWQGR